MSDNMLLIEKLRELAKAEMIAKNYDKAYFLLDVESVLSRLNMVVVIIARMYEKTGEEDAWEALFEALFETKILKPIESEGEVKP